MTKIVRQPGWLSTTLATVFLAGVGVPLRAADNHTHKCSVATLNGDYAFYRAGSTPDGTLAALGLIHFDGQGNFHATQNISRNGDYTFDLTFDGQYELADDCSGKGFQDGSEFVRLVVFRSGEGLYMFSESAGNAVYGVANRTQESDGH